MEKYILSQKQENSAAIYMGLNAESQLISVQDPAQIAKCLTAEQAKLIKIAMNKKEVRVKSLAQAMRDYCTWSILTRLNEIETSDDVTAAFLIETITPKVDESAAEAANIEAEKIAVPVEEVKPEAPKAEQKKSDKKGKKAA